MKKGIRFCFFGIYTPGYARNRVFLKGLRQNGVSVVEIRLDAGTRWRYFKLAWRLFKMRRSYDVIVAAFPSPTAAIVARLVSRKFLVVDEFYSMYDAVVNDRKEISRWHPRALKLLVLDWLSLLCADLIITDTAEHKKYWALWLWANSKKMEVVHIGAEIPKLAANQPSSEDGRLVVHFHGSYVPLQGVEAIVAAAALLKNDNRFAFRLIGDGQDFERAMVIAETAGIKKELEIIRRIDYGTLLNYISAADIVLGIFGTSEKAKRVIPNKVYEGAAAGKPIVTMDSRAIREVFSPSKDILVTEPTPEALAEALKRLVGDPQFRHALGAAALATAKKYSPQCVAEKLYTIVEQKIK